MQLSILLSLVAMLGYGVSAVFLKLAGNDGNPFLVTMIASLCMFLVAAAAWLFSRPTHIGSPTLSYAVMGGVISGIGFLAFIVSLSMGKVGVTSTIRGMSFVVATILAALLLHEQLSAAKWLGIVFAALSIILLSFP